MRFVRIFFVVSNALATMAPVTSQSVHRFPASEYSVTRSSTCYFEPVPRFAAEAGLSKNLFYICPSYGSINFSADQPPADLFNGVWWTKARPETTLYSTAGEVLQIRLGGVLSSVSPDNMIPSTLPLLPGDDSFYVEFLYNISDNDADHWPAIWLMPVEHNVKQEDHYANDPVGYERFTEIDIDEGGFNGGEMSSAISWKGIWPNYSKLVTNNSNNNVTLDRTVSHKFAALYDAKNLTVSYYCDDKFMFEAKNPYLDVISKQQHFYLIIAAQTHGKNLEYRMNLRRLRAYVSN